MKTIELTSGIFSSVIGFGCASILGSKDAKASKKALDFAIDHGIDHLDLARSYGYGEAEEFVGKAIAGKRKDLVLASKFGIEPTWKAMLLKRVKPFVRALKGNKGPANGNSNDNNAVTGGTGSKFVPANMFLKRVEPLREADMRRSLEKSLKSLRTDYLDHFFIHEPYTQVTFADELIHAADQLKAEGKIRSFGIAYMRSQQQMHESYINKFDLLQFNNPTDANEYNQLLADRKLKPNIMFSPFRGGLKNLTATQKMEKLLVDFPSTVILCSMFNIQHIADNIKLVEQLTQKIG